MSLRVPPTTPQRGPVPDPETSSPRPLDIRIASTTRPGFHAEPGYVPQVGERVETTEGEAEVVRILNRVTRGRLLELRLKDRPTPAFFAASSNILVGDGLPGRTTPDETSG